MKRLFITLINGYRKHISVHTPPSCRYIPTCSAYALEALEKYGVGRGLWLVVKRVCRCHPFRRKSTDIYDPVP